MADKPFEVVLFGATGFTGRQAVRALVHRGVHRPLRWAVAGRNAVKLEALVAEMVPPAVARPGILIADTGNLASLQALAGQADVVLNLAGPYAAAGESVVQACIAQRAHHLDLSGETFWVRQLIERHHRAAQRAGVKVVVCCGYEALPFDLATFWAATQVRERFGEPCREVKLIVRFTGRRIVGAKGAVSAGTLGSLRSLLESDRTDSVRNPACLLPPETAPVTARIVAARNAYRFVPRFDHDVHAVTAPTLPAPFVTPPVVLRSVALADDASLFTPDFRYAEAADMASLVPRHALLPAAASTALQWAAAAAIAVPLAHLQASVGGPLAFQRPALRELVDWLAPRLGGGPDDDLLDHSGYRIDVFGRSETGQRWRGRVEAEGHPGYRSAPEMAVTAALGLARGELGRTPHFGIVTPATGLGLDAVAALREAGVTFSRIA